jgi:hypothetical protein
MCHQCVTCPSLSVRSGLNPFGLEHDVQWRRLVVRDLESIVDPSHHCPSVDFSVGSRPANVWFAAKAMPSMQIRLYMDSKAPWYTPTKITAKIADPTPPRRANHPAISAL